LLEDALVAGAERLHEPHFLELKGLLHATTVTRPFLRETDADVKAIAVYPGEANSIHLADIPEPSVEDVPDGRGVLVEVLRVGVDGTDKEINEARYGAAPPGEDFLVTGHENFGRVLEVGRNVPTTITPGGLVVSTVRRPGHSIYDGIGLQDFTTDDVYYERGINLLHGYLTERYVEDSAYVVPLPESLREVGVLLEPTTVAEKGINQAYEIQRRVKVWRPGRAAVLGSGTIGLLAALILRLRGLEVVCCSLPKAPYLNSDLIEELGGTYVSTQDLTPREAAEKHGPFDLMFEATGFSPLVFEAAEALGKNGVLVLASVTGGDRKAEVPADKINQGFVLGNKVMVGTVNASKEDFERGVTDLIQAEAIYPGWLGKLLTTPVHGLDRYREMIEHLEQGDGIKTYVEVKP
jgi:threonine dehydrogenase-like Zn-dependent dehydrogenase